MNAATTILLPRFELIVDLQLYQIWIVQSNFMVCTIQIIGLCKPENQVLDCTIQNIKLCHGKESGPQILKTAPKTFVFRSSNGARSSGDNSGLYNPKKWFVQSKPSNFFAMAKKSPGHTLSTFRRSAAQLLCHGKEWAW
ncbi:hypothetical protein ACSSUR_28030 [Pseudomonas cedrina]|uniref:hypothetical protein n=1 Tax=Pseudomonas cedrina TaxID=651740 RepID=UPI003EDAE025